MKLIEWGLIQETQIGSHKDQNKVDYITVGKVLMDLSLSNSYKTIAP